MKVHNIISSALVMILIIVFPVSYVQSLEEVDSITIPLSPFQEHDGVVRVYESAFNDLAQAIPLTEKGKKPYTVRFCPLWCYTFALCSGEWSLNITELKFRITSAEVKVTGVVDGTYKCFFGDLPISGNLDTAVEVTYDAAERVIEVEPTSAIVYPKVLIPGYGWLDLPDQDVTSSLTLTPIPVAGTMFYFETARGPRSLHLNPENVQLTKENAYTDAQGNNVLGHIKLQSNIILW